MWNEYRNVHILVSRIKSWTGFHWFHWFIVCSLQENLALHLFSVENKGFVRTGQHRLWKETQWRTSALTEQTVTVRVSIILSNKGMEKIWTHIKALFHITPAAWSIICTREVCIRLAGSNFSLFSSCIILFPLKFIEEWGHLKVNRQQHQSTLLVKKGCYFWHA